MQKETYLDGILKIVIEKVKQFEHDSSMPYQGFINWLRNILRINNIDQGIAGVLYVFLLNTGYIQEANGEVIVNPSQ